MFGQGRFGLMRFAVREEAGDDVEYIATMHATMHQMAATGGNVMEMAIMSAMVESGLQGAPAVAISGKMAGAVQQQAAGSVRVVDPISMEAAVQGRMHASQDVAHTLSFAADTEGRQRGGMNIAHTAAMVASHHTFAAAGMNLLAPPMRMDAFFDAQITTAHFSILQALIDIEIPPGATLIIDSDTYNVLLNGVDRIDAHSGDWLHMTRRVHDLLIEPAGGTLSVQGQVLYTERYL